MQTKDVGVIIVAAGSGNRMGGGVPKQFLNVAGKEILVRCLEQFRTALPDSPIVVVVSESRVGQWEEIVARWSLAGSHMICTGGTTRYESVKRGLAMLPEWCSVIAVQDGVRPLLSRQLILDCVDAAREYGSAVPAVEVVDSFRTLVAGQSRAVAREQLRAVQTPQCFRAELLRRAYQMPYRDSFTDDAAVVESSGAPIHLCQGERENIKITTPIDLVVAEKILELRGR